MPGDEVEQEKQIDRLDWMLENLVIEPKVGGGVIAFIPNPAQQIIFRAILQQKNAGLPVRIIILKARQLGSSTGVAAWYFTDSFHEPNTNSLIAAHDDDGSWGIYRKYQRFYDHLEKKRPAKYSSRKELVFSAPHSSRIVVQTAGKLGLGRGDTYQYAHLSEVAWWPHASETMLAVQQAIPDSPGVCQIWESTANGLDGLFYEKWQAAVEYRRKYPKSLEGFTPLFLPWTIDPEYRRAVPDGVEVQMVPGLTREQCYWRQRTKDEKCQNDEDLFRQEYPLTPDEAFRTSGSAIFSATTIKRYRKTCRPGRFGDITPNGGIAPSVARANCWQIWEKPRTHGQYIVAADVAEGELSDRASDRSDRDYSAAVVLDRHKLAVLGVWHGRADTHHFGRALLQAAKWYNNAWVSPEVNGAGLAVLNVLRAAKYQYIYQRQSPDEKIDNKDAPALGWKTTVATRRLMADEFIRLIHEPGIAIYSDQIVDEMKSFVRDQTGKPIHAPGKHDDVLFALMIALQMHLRIPLLSEPMKADSTAELEESRVIVTPSFAYAGGTDNWEPEDEEDA